MEKTKAKEVLNYMRSHEEGISQLDAIKLCKATRLSAIIFDLRKRNYDIKSVWKESYGDYGTTRYVQYKLVGEPTIVGEPVKEEGKTA